jgi:hypothetical protein
MLANPVVRARCAALVAVAAAIAVVWSLWPGAWMPAWPAIGLGLLAVALALEPGPIGARATATLLGAAAALLGWVQVGMLWGVALAS